MPSLPLVYELDQVGSPSTIVCLFYFRLHLYLLACARLGHHHKQLVADSSLGGVADPSVFSPAVIGPPCRERIIA